MIPVPKLFRNTKTIRRINEYMDTCFDEVLHTTLNPDGPGAIRIHLIPPKKEEGALNPSIAIINGTDIIPVNFVSAVNLAEMIRETNKYDGKEISEADIQSILEKTVENVKAVIPLLSRKRISEDIRTIYTTIRQIAYREPVTTDVHYMSIGEYEEYMTAPHRMDALVSSMAKDGKWHCNQKCVHCYAAGQELSEEKELSTEEWKAIIDKCRAAGIPQITFTGGEPTMREDIFELIKYARWFISRLNTNGIKLTEDYCRKLHEAELDSVQITFYSSDPEVHNKLVGADKFLNTAKGIVNAVKEGLSVSINTPLCTLNKDYVKTLAYLHAKGVVYVTCSGMIMTGNATTEESENMQLSGEELEQILRDAVAYCNEHGMEIAFTSPGWIRQEVFEELKIPSPSCGACLSNMAITPAGNVVPCQSWLSDEPLGNMLRDDWETIWDSMRCTEHRDYSAEMTGECPLRRCC